jgi:hypothetical protein
MSFQTTALRYGWVYLTALGVITGTTIYVVNNTRQQVKPEDFIEIMLGTYERCLATQTSTNPTYSVDPVNLIQLWVKTNALVHPGWAYKVCYTSYWPSTTGIGIVQSYTSSIQPSINYATSWTATNGWAWTNVSAWPYLLVTDTWEYVTNTIGGFLNQQCWYLYRCNWLPDGEYMSMVDAKIKALIPYYVDTNTVYDGTTNIVMLTVTGLWASLGIGDKTNQFTRTPCWTNPISTNWIVNYISYWPSMNGTATNINYTSDYRQVINYAQSWTATGGHVWVMSSNWASQVVTVTNAATYDNYPQQIYVEDLQERYKVLNALKIFHIPRASIRASYERYYGDGGWNISSWLAAKSAAVSDFKRTEVYTNAYLGIDYFYCLYNGHYTEPPNKWKARIWSDYLQAFFISATTEINHRDSVFIDVVDSSFFTPDYTFDDNGLPVSEGVYSLIYEQAVWNNDAVVELPILFGRQTVANECEEPVLDTQKSQGFASIFANDKGLWVNREFQFNYCTNKYW